MVHTAMIISAIVIVVLYIVLCPRINYAFYRPLLFHPVPFDKPADAEAPLLEGVVGKDVSFKNVNGDMLYGWYFHKPDSEYTVLFSHGNGGNVGYRTDTCSLLLDAGLSVMIYDYRGYGNSHGLPTVEGVCHDAISAYDYLNKHLGVPDNKIILYGESLGCAITTNISTQRKSAGLILRSGFESLARIASEIFPALLLYPGPLLSDPPMNSMTILSKPHPPLLVIHGELDAVVPYAHAQSLFKGASEPKRFLTLPGTGHNDLCRTAPDEIRDAIKNFVVWINESGTARAIQTKTH